MNGSVSEWEEVKSSVVQGSVLGGILFIIFINNIDEAVLDASLWKFADDTKVARLIRSLEDARIFQQVIDKLCEWAETWTFKLTL